MKLFILLTSILATNVTFASTYNLVCAGRKCIHSPYPGAGSCSDLALTADLDKDRSSIKLYGELIKLDLRHVSRDATSGEVEIQGLTYKGEAVDLILNTLGARGARLEGKVGRHKVNYTCNRNLIINL